MVSQAVAVDSSSKTARRPIPGPVNRETFLDEQRRHRRAARAFGAMALVTAALIGTGVTALFTPTIYLLIAIGLRVTNAFVPSHANPDSP